MVDFGVVWFYFQFLILGYTSSSLSLTYGRLNLSIPHFRIPSPARASRKANRYFQFLILGYRPVSGSGRPLPPTFNSSFQDTAPTYTVPYHVLHFQFLILGYQYKVAGKGFLWGTFNSSFQDTVSFTEKTDMLQLFQFLILGYPFHCEAKKISESLYFQFLILGYQATTAGSNGNLCFQFLILGYYSAAYTTL